MSFNSSQIFKLSACVLVGVIAGFAGSHAIDRISYRKKVTLSAAAYLQVDGAPSFVADFANTGHEGYSVTFIAADKSEILIMFARDRVVKIFRSTSDQENKYMFFDDNADGIPEFKKIRNLSTGESITERLQR